MTVSRGPPAPPQAENFLDHRFVRLVYEGSGEERRDRDWRKSAARGGGGQGLIGRVTSTLAPNGGYAHAPPLPCGTTSGSAARRPGTAGAPRTDRSARTELAAFGFEE